MKQNAVNAQAKNIGILYIRKTKQLNFQHQRNQNIFFQNVQIVNILEPKCTTVRGLTYFPKSIFFLLHILKFGKILH